LPASAFLYRFLQYFEICLNHLTLSGVLHLSVSIHLSEAFLGIPLLSPCFVISFI
jgi:hypothetical protein